MPRNNLSLLSLLCPSSVLLLLWRWRVGDEAGVSDGVSLLSKGARSDSPFWILSIVEEPPPPPTASPDAASTEVLVFRAARRGSTVPAGEILKFALWETMLVHLKTRGAGEHEKQDVDRLVALGQRLVSILPRSILHLLMTENSFYGRYILQRHYCRHLNTSERDEE